MGIDCCFGTPVEIGERLSADSIEPRGGRWLVAGSDWEHCHGHFLGAERVQTHVDRE